MASLLRSLATVAPVAVAVYERKGKDIAMRHQSIPKDEMDIENESENLYLHYIDLSTLTLAHPI